MESKINLFATFLKTELAMRGVAAAALYGVCSVSMAFINKGLMTSFDFDFPVCIMIMQMIFTICLLETLSFFRMIHLPSYTLERGHSFAFPAIFYAVNSVLGLNALSHMNVAMYGVLKRCVPLATMLLSFLVLKKGFPSKITMLSVSCITIGCIIAGFGDLKFSYFAYACGALSNVTHALYLLLVQKSTEKDLTVVETLQLNSFNSLPLLSVYAFFSGELSDVMNYGEPVTPVFLMVLLLTIGIGCLLNYSLFLCTSLTSALTTSVVGGIKALLQTVIGMFTFGGISHNLTTYIGITVNLTGSILYLYAKYKEGISRGQQPGGKIHKVISVSSAEDFKELQKSSNGSVYRSNNELLHPIGEEGEECLEVLSHDMKSG